MLGKRRNKKGSIQDMAFLVAVIFFIGLLLLIGFRVTDAINQKVQTDNPGLTANQLTTVDELTGSFPGVLDNTVGLFLPVMLGIITLVLAALVRINPVFIPFFFLGLIILIIVSGALSNIYQEMASSAALSSYADQLVFTTQMLTYLPFIIGIFGFALMVVMYKTWRVNL